MKKDGGDLLCLGVLLEPLSDWKMLEFCLLSVFFQCEDYNDRELKGDSTDEKTDDNAVDTGKVDTVCEWNNITSSSVSAFPAISLGFTILGEIFKHMLLFFFLIQR